MINLQAQGAMPGPKGIVNIAAAVMYSGGSHMCYADQPLALSQCSNCTNMDGDAAKFASSRRLERNDSSMTQWPGGTGAYTCSGDLVTNHSEVACDYCCPQNVTELHYLHHPEDCKSRKRTLATLVSTVSMRNLTCRQGTWCSLEKMLNRRYGLRQRSRLSRALV